MRFCATLFELLPTDSSLKNSLKKKKEYVTNGFSTRNPVRLLFPTTYLRETFVPLHFKNLTLYYSAFNLYDHFVSSFFSKNLSEMWKKNRWIKCDEKQKNKKKKTNSDVFFVGGDFKRWPGRTWISRLAFGSNPVPGSGGTLRAFRIQTRRLAVVGGKLCLNEFDFPVSYKSNWLGFFPPSRRNYYYTERRAIRVYVPFLPRIHFSPLRQIQKVQ